MAVCPVCHNPLHDDFGLVDCSHCGAGLFVEFDGSVRRRDERAKDDSGPQPIVVDSVVKTKADVTGMAPLTRAESSPIHQAPAGSVVTQFDLGQSSEVTAHVEGPVGLTQVEKTLATQGALGESTALESIPMSLAPPMQVAEVGPVAEGLSDLADFGNSDASSGREGQYQYTLLISGIDTAEIRQRVKEALTDQLFVWDAEAFLKDVSSGSIRLANVPAVKASLLLNRLSGLPLEIIWEQHALTSV